MPQFSTQISNNYPIIMEKLSINSVQQYIDAIKKFYESYQLLATIKATIEDTDNFLSPENFNEKKDEFINIGRKIKEFIKLIGVLEETDNPKDSQFFYSADIFREISLVNKIAAAFDDAEEGFIAAANFLYLFIDVIEEKIKNINSFFSSIKNWITKELTGLLKNTFTFQGITLWIKALTDDILFFTKNANIAIFIQFPGLEFQFEFHGLYFSLENNLPIPKFDELKLVTDINKLKGSKLTQGLSNFLSSNFPSIKITKLDLNTDELALGKLGPLTCDLEVEMGGMIPDAKFEGIKIMSTGEIIPPSKVLGGSNVIIPLFPPQIAMHECKYILEWKEKSFGLTTTLAPQSPSPPTTIKIVSDVTVFPERFELTLNGTGYVFNVPLVKLDAQFKLTPLLIRGNYQIPHPQSPTFISRLVKSDGHAVVGKESGRNAGIFMQGKTTLLEGLITFSSELDLDFDAKTLSIKAKDSVSAGINFHQEGNALITIVNNNAKLAGTFYLKLNLNLKYPFKDLSLFSITAYVKINLEYDNQLKVDMEVKAPPFPVFSISSIVTEFKGFTKIIQLIERRLSEFTENYFDMLLNKLRNLDVEVNENLRQAENRFRKSVYQKAEKYGIEKLKTGDPNLDHFFGEVTEVSKKAFNELKNKLKVNKNVVKAYHEGIKHMSELTHALGLDNITDKTDKIKKLLNDIVFNPKELVDDLEKGYKEMAEAGANAIKNLNAEINNINEKTNEAIKQFNDLIGQLENINFNEELKSVADKLGSIAEKIKNSLNQINLNNWHAGIINLGETSIDAINNIKENLGGLVNKVNAAIEEAGEKIKDTIENAGRSIAEAGHAAGGAIAEGAHEAGGAIAEGAHEVGGAIAEGAHNAGGELAEGAHNAGGELAEGAHNVGEGLVEAGHRVGGIFGRSSFSMRSSRVRESELSFNDLLPIMPTELSIITMPIIPVLSTEPSIITMPMIPTIPTMPVIHVPTESMEVSPKEQIKKIANDVKNQLNELKGSLVESSSLMQQETQKNWIEQIANEIKDKMSNILEQQKQQVVQDAFYQDYSSTMRKIKVSEMSFSHPQTNSTLQIKFLYPSISALNLSDGLISCLCQIEAHTHEDTFSEPCNIKIYLSNCYLFNDKVLEKTSSQNFKIHIEPIAFPLIQEFDSFSIIYSRLYDILVTTIPNAKVIETEMKKFNNKHFIFENISQELILLHYKYEKMSKNKTGFWQQPMVNDNVLPYLEYADFTKSVPVPMQPNEKISFNAHRVRFWSKDQNGKILDNQYYYKDLNLIPPNLKLEGERAYLADEYENYTFLLTKF